MDRSFKINTVPIGKIERKEIEFYLKDFMPLPKATVGMIASKGGMGKTFLSLRIASEFVKETGGNVLTWFSEDEAEIIGFRFDKLVDEFGIQKDTQDNIHYVTTSPLQFAKKDKGTFKADYESISDIRKHVIENDIKLVIIDPLLAFYGGDENDNSQARIFMQVFLEWAKQDGVNILFIHHAKKGDGGTRGASAFIDAVRFAYELHYPEFEDDDGTMIPDVEKAKDGVRVVRLVKDNHFAMQHFERVYGSQDGEIHILPPRREYSSDVVEVTYEPIEIPYISEHIGGTDLVTVSYATHNDAKNAHGFERHQVEFNQLMDVMTMGVAYSPAGFKNGHRKSENYLGDTNVVFLDIDDGMTFKEAQTVYSDYKAIMVTTRSHQKEKNGVVCDRFRVALKLDEPIDLPAKEYKIALQSIFDYFGNVDESTKDPARFFFSSPIDCEVHFTQGTKELKWRELYDKEMKLRFLEQYKRQNQTLVPTEVTNDSIETALRKISPDCAYEQWVEIGMAIKSELGEGGFTVWDTWSRGSDKYNEREMMNKWNSFNGAGVSIGTLFYYAKGF